MKRAAPPALLLLLAFCSRHEATRSNVLLITLDTFRADRVATSPNLSKVARSGTWYQQADAAAPLTLPSHATILSGLLPPHHGLRNNGIGTFPQRDTLATVFGKAGYRTGAFVSAFILDRRFGLARGFETYDDDIARDPNDAKAGFEAERRGGETVDRALAWLKQTDARPWFAWVHLYDAHAPYAPPSPYPQTYDGEIAYVDAQVGRLLDAIDRDKTLVVVVGDHGESLGEHGELTHGLLLYESTLHVPLIFNGPGVKADSVQQPISTAEVAPKIASLAGLSMQHEDAGGIYAETEYTTSFGWSGLTSLRRDNIKLIRGAMAEVFDVQKDPGEKQNIINDQRRMYSDLGKRLDAIGATAVASSGHVDDETRAKLASLGYIAPGNAHPSHRDPREMAPLFLRYEEAQARNSIPELAQLVAADPANPVFRSTLARAYKAAGALDRAIPLYREAVAIAPADPDGWFNLATALTDRGQAAEALKVAIEAVRLDPSRPDAHNVLGVAYVQNGNPAAAEAEFQKTADLDPRNARAYNNLGNVYQATGRIPDAESAYQRALDSAPDYVDALNGLGSVKVKLNKPAEAIALFDKALAIAPGFFEAEVNRAIALGLSDRVSESRQQLEQTLARLPKEKRYDDQRKLVQTLLSRLPGAR